MVRKSKDKNIYSTIGSILILLAISVFCNYHIYYYVLFTRDNKTVNEIINKEKYYEDESNSVMEVENIKSEKSNDNLDTSKYIGVLEIPKISLKKGFLAINDINNNVDKNLQVLNKSTMPDEKDSILAIAAHSGYGSLAFFNDLHKLEKGDETYIYYKGVKYIYKIIDKYAENKDGTIEINSNKRPLLVLTTCSQEDKTKQIVVLAELVNKNQKTEAIF